jgi:hypothetical protein
MDMNLTSRANFVQAMGGELEIRARVDDGRGRSVT